MKTTPFTHDDGTKGLSIEIDGRGADFYADGTYFAWDGDGMFNRCEATNNLTPYVNRKAVKEAFAIAEKELSAEFEVGTIGVFVDADGNVDPTNLELAAQAADRLASLLRSKDKGEEIENCMHGIFPNEPKTMLVEDSSIQAALSDINTFLGLP